MKKKNKRAKKMNYLLRHDSREKTFIYTDYFSKWSAAS